MKKPGVISLIIIALTVGCANPNQEFIEKIKVQVKEDALGIDMKYENISFEWSDTLVVKEQLSELKSNFDTEVDNIAKLEYRVNDNFEKGNIFSIAYLSKNRLIELRNWEKNNRGIPFNSEYNDYYQFAFANRDASEWISELCTQIEETDKLLDGYESIKEGDLALIKNVLWYYSRIDNFNSNGSPSKIWAKISTELEELTAIDVKIDSLSNINPDKVIHYKGLNKYKIINPLLNNASMEVEKYFLFDEQFKIIGKEDLEK
jgi:hypothetical protein